VREKRSERKADTRPEPSTAETEPVSKIENPITGAPSAGESEGKKKFVKSYGS
jgi:hypothetical protein